MPKLTTNEEKSFLGKAYKLETQQQTDDLYAVWAETYDKDLADKDYHQPKRCAEAMHRAGVAVDANILDVGCGTGLFCLELKKLGFSQIDGTDISVAMLEKAQPLNIYGKLFEADLNKPPLDVADATYDAIGVVGVFSFGHVMPDALDEILRMLKPDGILVIGLNQYFYDESDLPQKIDALEADRQITKLNAELGFHMAKTDTKGWVITLQKN